MIFMEISINEHNTSKKLENNQTKPKLDLTRYINELYKLINDNSNKVGELDNTIINFLKNKILVELIR